MATARIISAPTRWRWRRSPAGSPISTKATGRSSPTTGRDLRSRQSAGRPRDGRIRRQRGSHREGQSRAISCRRRFSSSPWSSPRRSAPICARSSRRWRCRDMDFSFGPVPRVTIVACGTSYYAGMVAKYWLERFARVPVELDVASEFRYRDPVLEPGGLALFISQSGETADTLAALRHARAAGPEDRGRGQRPDQLDGARGGPAAADPCRPGDRRRLDQGLHLPARRARRARRQGRARQGRDERGGGARDRPPSQRGARGDERGARP